MKKIRLTIVLLLMVLSLTSACVFGGGATPSAVAPTMANSPAPSISVAETPPAVEATPARSPTAPADAPDESRDLTISILYDNTAYDARLRAEWGFAALIEYGDNTLLFDTGGDGATLMDNMAQMGIDPQPIEAIVLSHIHGDHTNGLQSVLDAGVTPTVYVPASFPASFKRNVRSYTDLVEITDPIEIFPGLHSTGELGASIVEQALVVETGSGIVVVTGCAHPGVVQIVQQAKTMVEDEVALVVGGFHLRDHSSSQVRQIVAELRELGVRRVCPTHCTGEEAIAIFAEEYGEVSGDGYVQGGVGRVITIAAEEALVPDLSDDEVATLSSLEQVDDYPLYTMRYYGPYQQRASAIEREGWACSLFAALGDADNLLYGRNFDWRYSPAVLLFTDPPDGYASVSMVDIAYLGFDGDRALTLKDLPLIERRSLLNAPFWPFDGMNERGLVVGMAAVPPGDMQPDPNKETVDSLGIIREMLDYASNVDEAATIMQSYNVDMGGGPPLHYLLADRSGRAILVEFYQGQVVVIPNENDAAWHLATNFLRASVEGDAEGQCWRYDTLRQRLAEAQGGFTAPEAVDLLAEVAQGGTQWSVVYGISRGDVHVVMGRQYDDVHLIPGAVAGARWLRGLRPARALSPGSGCLVEEVQN